MLTSSLMGPMVPCNTISKWQYVSAASFNPFYTKIWILIALTCITIWLIVAFQSKKYFAEDDEATVFRNLLWPYKAGKRFWRKARGLPPKNRKKNDDYSVWTILRFLRFATRHTTTLPCSLKMFSRLRLLISMKPFGVASCGLSYSPTDDVFMIPYR